MQRAETDAGPAAAVVAALAASWPDPTGREHGPETAEDVVRAAAAVFESVPGAGGVGGTVAGHVGEEVGRAVCGGDCAVRGRLVGSALGAATGVGVVLKTGGLAGTAGAVGEAVGAAVEEGAEAAADESVEAATEVAEEAVERGTESVWADSPEATATAPERAGTTAGRTSPQTTEGVGWSGTARVQATGGATAVTADASSKLWRQTGSAPQGRPKSWTSPGREPRKLRRSRRARDRYRWCSRRARLPRGKRPIRRVRPRARIGGCGHRA